MGEFDKYTVKVDGTGRLTNRNKRFLRKVHPYQPRQPVPKSQPEAATSQSSEPAMQVGDRVDQIRLALDRWEDRPVVLVEMQQHQQIQGDLEVHGVPRVEHLLTQGEVRYRMDQWVDEMVRSPRRSQGDLGG